LAAYRIGAGDLQRPQKRRVNERQDGHMDQSEQLRLVHRTCRVPLRISNQTQWIELRRIAYLCASFGNHLLTESYAKAKGVSGLHPYSDYRAMLSAAVRDAVSSECVSIWSKLGRQILRGEQTLARFAVDRALVVRGQAVSLERTPADGLVLRARLLPAQAGPAMTFAVWMPALRRDRWLSDVLGRLESASYRLTRLAVVFERPGRKVAAFVSYCKPVGTSVRATNEAMFECANQDCRLRCGEHALSLNDAIHRLTVMKEHFAGIHSRLRRHLGKRGRRHAFRQALLKAGTFEQWAQGPIHQLSRQIVDWCREHNVGELRWNVEQASAELPWARLEAFVIYKAEDANIRVLNVASNEADISKVLANRMMPPSQLSSAEE
jgi:hypothetical protein